MVAIGLGVISHGLDIALHSDRFAKTMEETLEPDGAIALLFSAWLLPGPRKG